MLGSSDGGVARHAPFDIDSGSGSVSGPEVLVAAGLT